MSIKILFIKDKIKYTYTIKNMESKTLEKVHEYSIKKSEKITIVVLHILSKKTGNIVLKDKIIRHSMEFFELCASLGYEGWFPKRQQVAAHIAALEGLLNIAERLGMFPKGSAQVISGECKDLFMFLDEYGHLITGEPARIDKESLKVDFFSQGHVSELKKQKIETKGHIKDIIQNKTSDLISSKGHTRDNIKIGDNTRKMVIISHVPKGSRVSVKDIQGAIPNVSVKTLQRELSSLVESGVLKKEGVRRWTLYSLSD